MTKHMLSISTCMAVLIACAFSARAAGDFEIQDKGVGYEVKIDIAGLDKETLNVEIDQQRMVLSGQNSSETEERSPGSYVSVKSYSSFSRTVPLPEDADPAKVSSEMIGETLVVRIQKKGR
jgi:HSP20 family protein